MNINNVPLLPALVKRALDASRAIREGVHDVIEQVRDKTLTSLLNLPHFEVTGYAKEKGKKKGIIHLFCQLTIEMAICPSCQAVTTDVRQYKERCIRDVDVWGQKTFIHFEIRRFECDKCGLRFTEEIEAVGFRRRQTKRFEREVYEHCVQSNQRAIAIEYELSESTVAIIFKRWAKAQKRCYPPVRILGMDEITLKKRHKQYVLVLSDWERKYVLTVLPSRDQATLAAWIKGLSKTERKAIRVVSMDMWRPYRAIVAKLLPQANIVADRFHVMKQLNEQLHKARRQIQGKADEATQKSLKGCRWLLLRSRETLTAEQEQQLIMTLSCDSQLRTAYLLKEEFRLIFDKIHDQEQAERFLRAWIFKVQQSNNRYLLSFVKTLHNWWAQILNYFDERITNGFVEGLNHAIRAIIWAAYGFRNFNNFRLRILAQLGPPG